MDCVSDFFAVDFGDDFELNGNFFFTAFQNLCGVFLAMLNQMFYDVFT